MFFFVLFDGKREADATQHHSLRRSFDVADFDISIGIDMFYVCVIALISNK